MFAVKWWELVRKCDTYIESTLIASNTMKDMRVLRYFIHKAVIKLLKNVQTVASKFLFALIIRM